MFLWGSTYKPKKQSPTVSGGRTSLLTMARQRPKQRASGRWLDDEMARKLRVRRLVCQLLRVVVPFLLVAVSERRRGESHCRWLVGPGRWASPCIELLVRRSGHPVLRGWLLAGSPCVDDRQTTWGHHQTAEHNRPQVVLPELRVQTGPFDLA